MKQAKNLGELQHRVEDLIDGMGSAIQIDISTNGWGSCAVGLKLKEIGINLNMAEKQECSQRQLVETLVKDEIYQKGRIFNKDLHTKAGLKRCLKFIKELRNLSPCRILTYSN